MADRSDEDLEAFGLGGEDGGGAAAPIDRLRLLIEAKKAQRFLQAAFGQLDADLDDDG